MAGVSLTLAQYLGYQGSLVPLLCIASGFFTDRPKFVQGDFSKQSNRVFHFLQNEVNELTP